MTEEFGALSCGTRLVCPAYELVCDALKGVEVPPTANTAPIGVFARWRRSLRRMRTP